MNGCTGYTEDQAALGTVRRELFLQIPSSVILPPDFDPGSSPFTTGTNVGEFVSFNMKALSKANVRREVAEFLVLLRLQMVLNGFACSSIEKRSVYVNEYETVTGPVGELTDFKPNPETVTFVSNYWQNICAVVAHVFRVRGHHWKPEYEDVYDRTWRSTVIEVTPGVVFPTWEEIAITGLHCFGVRSLFMVREWAHSQGTLARGIVVRLNAACAGSAPVRTAAAALRDMAKAKWWTYFYVKFQVQIDALLEQSDKLEAMGTKAHVNARLYNWDDKHVPLNEEGVCVLAPYIMGWIDTLEKEEPISKQSAITKRAQGGSAIRRDFSRVLQNEARDSQFLGSVKAYFNT